MSKFHEVTCRFRGLTGVSFAGNLSAMTGADVPVCSILIPTRNRAERLTDTLRALGRQEGIGQAEVIVVDDGSTDSTAERIRAMAERLPTPLRMLAQAHRGPAAARNLGLREARGPLVIFTGDDIEPYDGWLAAHIAAHRSRADETVAVLGKTWPPPQTHSAFMRFLMEESSAQFGYAALDRGQIPDYRFFYTSNLSVKKSVLAHEEGPFDERFESAAWEDIDLGVRLTRRGLTIVYEPAAGAVHHHLYTLPDFLRRQESSGRMAFRFLQKHPELEKDVFPPDVSPMRRLFRTFPNSVHALLGAMERLCPDPPAGKLFYRVLLASAFECGYLNASSGESPGPARKPGGVSGSSSKA